MPKTATTRGMLPVLLVKATHDFLNNTQNTMSAIQPPQSLCHFGIARRDITPPVGIYHRMWGAAEHTQATGIHRPLTATALVFQQLNEPATSTTCQILVAVDHVLLWAREMTALTRAVCEQAGIMEENLAITFSHTHAAGLLDLERVALPGGEMIPHYLQTLAKRIAECIQEARSNLEAASITYGTARCTLAKHRDFHDAESDQYVCGYNPDGLADDTVLIARIDTCNGDTAAVVVNYACHPTTLAWQNTLISPDYVGALREVVEEETGALCVFLQGASGDLGPRHGYVEDVEIADRNGYQLGFAVLSELVSLPAPLCKFRYTGPVLSGATLGVWEEEPLDMAATASLTSWQLRRWTVELPYRDDLPTVEQTRRELSSWREQELTALEKEDEEKIQQCLAMKERLQRQLSKLENLPQGQTFPFPVTLWQMGDAIWVAVEGELYHWFQKTLRERCPDVPVIVITLTGGWRPGYVPTADTYGKGIYQETIAVLAAGCLEALADAVTEQIQAWL